MSDSKILGTYDLEKKVEDTLILLEATMKNYGNPNRAVTIENAILQLVKAKASIDGSDRFALMTFGEKIETILEFSDFSFDEISQRLYNKVNILGNKAYVIDAVSAGFKIIAKSMMQLFEGKTFRMIIITEGDVTNREGQQDWRELVDHSEKIGIFIDVVEITNTKHQNVLRSLVAGTKGEYIISSESDAEAYVSSLAPKKKQVSVNETEADKNMKAFLEIIAQPLESLEKKIKLPSDLLKFVKMEDSSTKCAICYSDSCMICRGPSYACGSFCPNCGRFFHEHCFAAWAENSKDSPSPNIGKCPLCFALLKVPGAMYRVKVLQGKLKGAFDVSDQKFTAQKVKAKDLGLKGSQISCSFCRNIFDANEEIFECGNPDCHAYYHQNCFQAMAKHTKDRCRVCDTVQTRRFDANPGLQRIT
jgi:hypothetical protein